MAAKLKGVLLKRPGLKVAIGITLLAPLGIISSITAMGVWVVYPLTLLAKREWDKRDEYPFGKLDLDRESSNDPSQ